MLMHAFAVPPHGKHFFFSLGETSNYKKVSKKTLQRQMYGVCNRFMEVETPGSQQRFSVNLISELLNPRLLPALPPACVRV